MRGRQSRLKGRDRVRAGQYVLLQNLYTHFMAF